MSEIARLRIDKWLWAARFFKTRSLASQAVEGGRVKLNGDRVKPAKEIRHGDGVSIHIGDLEWDVEVCGISDRRGPASQARLLYTESEASLVRRQERVAQRKQHMDPADTIKGRPTKRDRRLIHRFTEDG